MRIRPIAQSPWWAESTSFITDPPKFPSLLQHQNLLPWYQVTVFSWGNTGHWWLVWHWYAGFILNVVHKLEQTHLSDLLAQNLSFPRLRQWFSRLLLPPWPFSLSPVSRLCVFYHSLICYSFNSYCWKPWQLHRQGLCGPMFVGLFLCMGTFVWPHSWLIGQGGGVTGPKSGTTKKERRRRDGSFLPFSRMALQVVLTVVLVLAAVERSGQSGPLHHF